MGKQASHVPLFTKYMSCSQPFGQILAEDTLMTAEP